MADEIENATTTPAASTEAPSAEVAVSPSPESTETVVTETTAPATEVAAPEETVKPDTLLGGEKTPEEKPEEEKPQETPSEEKPEESKEVEIPTYEPFALPEGLVVDEAKMGEFTKSLADFEITSKAPHEEVQKLGQQMVERHIAEIQRYNEALTQAWNKQKSDWKDNFLKDPEFANRTDTVINSAIDAIGVYGGSAEQQNEFRGLMESTGVGNHPAMIRLLSNIMLAKAEPKALAAPQIAPTEKMSKISKMYGKKSGS